MSVIKCQSCGASLNFPENAEFVMCHYAYLAKLMASLMVKKKEPLAERVKPFIDSRIFPAGQGLQGLGREIQGLQKKHQQIYTYGCEEMTASRYQNAIYRFEDITGWPDADAKLKECGQKIYDNL